MASERLPDGSLGTWCGGDKKPNRMLALPRGAPVSQLEQIWPLAGWRPLSTYCANLQYVFLMNETLKRLATQVCVRFLFDTMTR